MTTTTLQPLTDCQRRIYRWIVTYWKTERLAPSYRDIAVAFGINVNAARGHVRAMQRKGWLEQRNNIARSTIPTYEALANG